MRYPINKAAAMERALQQDVSDTVKVFFGQAIDIINAAFMCGSTSSRPFQATPEGIRGLYAQVYGQPADGTGQFFEMLAGHVNGAYQAGASSPYVTVPLSGIKIFPSYAAHPPKAEKMERKEWEYACCGLAKSDIVLDARNYLIDGYTYYLIAREYGLTHVPVRYSSCQIVRAYYRQGGKLYTWKLPEKLTDRVDAGDRLIVSTKWGLRTVTVAAVEEYDGQEQAPLRMAIRKRKERI